MLSFSGIGKFDPAKAATRRRTPKSGSASHESSFVPIDCLAQPFIKGCLCSKAKPFKSALSIYLTTGLAVRLIWLPSDLAFKTCQANDDLDQLSDCNLRTVPQIDRIAVVLRSCGFDNSLRAIINVK